MSNVFCACLYKTYVDDYASTWSTVAELVVSFIIGVCGVSINCVFLKKLQKEKKAKPLDRKGNVIEPLMGCFCVVQIIYWPYYLLLFWIWFNEIIPSDNMNGWWCPVLVSPLRFGRIYIGYNSFFCAFIRYLYIVHQNKANQWKFVKVAKMFQISSVAVPITLEMIQMFINPIPLFTNLHQTDFKECFASYQGVNCTESINDVDPNLVAWARHYVQGWMMTLISYIYTIITIVALFNVTEGFLYLQIYRSISR